ncbi:MAG: hypothetical protein V9E85_05195 [Candidatus Nanopelagicales bacterium]
MTRLRRSDVARDDGSAVVEFVVLAVMIMVPLVYAAVVVLKVHSATYAAVTAAREAGRAYVTADTTSAASARARSAARIALADHGLPEPNLSIACVDGTCLAPGSGIRVEVRTEVPIPFSPFGDGRSVIPVSAIHQTRVDIYRRG